MEAYYTIQGEGFNTGVPAFFIRLGGCDVGCHWCDVKESWDASAMPLVPVEKIVTMATQYPSKIAVITGGEPLAYPLEPLTTGLHSVGIKTWMETSGAYPFSGSFDWVCLSPKKTMPPVEKIHRAADELKIIIHNKDDFRWAEQHASMVRKKCILFLQPEWGMKDEMMPAIADYVKENPKWRVSLQAHKYIGLP